VVTRREEMRDASGRADPLAIILAGASFLYANLRLQRPPERDYSSALLGSGE
jgi:hypothetical protein